MRTSRWSFAAAFIFLAATILPDTAAAQMPLHFVAGPNLGTISSDEFDGASTAVGFFAGVGTTFMLTETVGVSPYLAYVQKGAEFDSETASYDYIEIPVLIVVGVPVGEGGTTFNIFGGPQVGFQMNCDEGGFDCTEFDDHKGTEFGVLGGVGLGFPMGESGTLGVSVGADLGLTDLFDTVSYKTRTYFLSLQYSVVVGGM
jgi:hypothetical protein